MLKGTTAELCGKSTLRSQKKLPNCFLEWMYYFTFPPTVYEWYSFSIPLSALSVIITFYLSHYDRSDIFMLLICISPNGYWWWTSYHMLMCHLYIPFDEVSVHVLCAFSNWILCGFFVCFVFTVVFESFLCTLYTQVLCWTYDLQIYFLPKLPFHPFSRVFDIAKVLKFDDVQFFHFSFLKLIFKKPSGQHHPQGRVSMSKPQLREAVS